MNQYARPILATAIGATFGIEEGSAASVATAVALSASSGISVSLGKTALTFASNFLPDGISQVIRSVVEEGNAVLITVLAILAPILAVLLAIMMIGSGILIFLLLRRMTRKMRAKFANYRDNKAALSTARIAQKRSGRRLGVKDMFRKSPGAWEAIPPEASSAYLR